LVSQIPILGPVVLIGKVILFLIFMVWIRATLPRIRYDRLMSFGWKVLLPLALVAVVWSAISIVIGDTFQDELAYMIFSGGVFAVVIAIGLMVLFRRQRAATFEKGDDPANDPIITGEQRGIGQAILQVVGTLIAIPMSLLNLTADQLEKIAALDPEYKENQAPALPEGKFVPKIEASLRTTSVAPRPAAPALAAPARKAAAPAVTAEATARVNEAAASATSKDTPPTPSASAAAKTDAGTGKAKFDKEAMLAKIREKKAK
jgi:hypothetical protein